MTTLIDHVARCIARDLYGYGTALKIDHYAHDNIESMHRRMAEVAIEAIKSYNTPAPNSPEELWKPWKGWPRLRSPATRQELIEGYGGGGPDKQTPCLRPPMPAPAVVCDLYFHPNQTTEPTLRIKKSPNEPGYLFQRLSLPNMDIESETYHLGLHDALQQVVACMRYAKRPIEYRVEAY